MDTLLFDPCHIRRLKYCPHYSSCPQKGATLLFICFERSVYGVELEDDGGVLENQHLQQLFAQLGGCSVFHRRAR